MDRTILYSTTRQYNPGDEFILFGIRNIFDKCGIKENPIIYNRNQEVNQPLSYLNPLRKIKSQSKWIKALGSFFRISQVDNSFKDCHDLSFVDMVVFAGSPEWASERLEPLYRKLSKFSGDIIFLGLGSFSSQKRLKEIHRDILSKSKIITYRTELLSDAFLEFNHAQYLPCPALLSCKNVAQFDTGNPVCITYGVNAASKGNHVSNSASQKMKSSYFFLKERGIDVDIICHYIDEVPLAKNEFPDARIRYSYDASEYKKIYSDYSMVITSRVHGVGICASLGIPGLLISHDGRADTAKGFLAEIISDEMKNDIFFESILRLYEIRKEMNQRLVNHKEKTLKDYEAILSPHLG